MKTTKLTYKGQARRAYATLHDTYIELPFSSSFYWVGHSTGKMAIATDRDADFEVSKKTDRTLYPYQVKKPKLPQKGDSLFVSSNCKLPRALLRDNGYKIVNDQDKADFVVTPRVCSNKWKFEECNIAVEWNDTLYLVAVNYYISHQERGPLLAHQQQMMMKLLQERFDTTAVFHYNPDMAPFKVYFTQKNKEYEDILFDRYPNIEYISENFVQLGNVTQINEEVLAVWCKMDKTLFTQSVVNSNWREYPFTMYNLIMERCSMLHIGPAAFNSIINELASTHHGLETDITVKDWNMCQKMYMLWLGLSEEGGYVEESKVSGLNWDARNYILNNRIAVKPKLLKGEDDAVVKFRDVRIRR